MNLLAMLVSNNEAERPWPAGVSGPEESVISGAIVIEVHE